MSESVRRPEVFGAGEQPLAAVLLDILHGPWQFIQLRGEPLDKVLSNGRWPLDEDVDLLGTEDSAMMLIEALHTWCLQGRIHFSVDRRRHRKIRLILYSVDACQQVMFDLWIEIPQLPKLRSRMIGSSFENQQLRARGCLRFDHCRNLIGGGATDEAGRLSVIRLPVAVEFCLYICHLESKRKDLKSDSVQARLSHYHDQLDQSAETRLASLAASLKQAQQLDAGVVIACGEYVYKSLSEAGEIDNLPVEHCEPMGRWWIYHWMQPPRAANFVFVTGCDGAGKTAVCRQMQSQWPDRFQMLTGKHLYRKSLFYKLLVILIRPLLFQDRERFDETMAPLAYLLASTRLSLRSLTAGLTRSNECVTFIDRSLLDFLIVDRKSNRPRLSWASSLRNLFGLRYPVVHLHVSEHTVFERKQEMSVESQRDWNKLVFRTLTGTGPVRYIGLSNSGTLQSSSEVLNRILSEW